jgi:acyl-CoA thioester hydrolase
MQGFHDVLVRVRFAETDLRGAVHCSRFLLWFEIARIELIRGLGIEYVRMEAEGCYDVVVNARCRYLSPARRDDVLRIRSRIVESRNRSTRFSYEVFREEGVHLLATGETTHIVCGRNGKSKTIPEKYRALLRAADISAPGRPNHVDGPLYL